MPIKTKKQRCIYMASKTNLDEIPSTKKGKKEGPRVFYFNFKEGEEGYDKLVYIEQNNKRGKDVVAYLLAKYI